MRKKWILRAAVLASMLWFQVVLGLDLYRRASVQDLPSLLILGQFWALATGIGLIVGELMGISRSGPNCSAPDRAAPVTDLDRMLSQLRHAGWTVAVHNDYRLDGKSFTFWLFTHPSGRWVKGEGPTDCVAVDRALASAEDRHV